MRAVAQADITVFINGPTGTGKEVLSQFIHLKSGRSKGPFVPINCAAIPKICEAILFGHEKGSFTGASTSNKGILEQQTGVHYYLMRFLKCRCHYKRNY